MSLTNCSTTGSLSENIYRNDRYYYTVDEIDQLVMAIEEFCTVSAYPRYAYGNTIYCNTYVWEELDNETYNYFLSNNYIGFVYTKTNPFNEGVLKIISSKPGIILVADIMAPMRLSHDPSNAFSRVERFQGQAQQLYNYIQRWVIRQTNL
jgi:hypothetical protein